MTLRPTRSPPQCSRFVSLEFNINININIKTKFTNVPLRL
jgi:hypothetical protein